MTPFTRTMPNSSFTRRLRRVAAGFTTAAGALVWSLAGTGCATTPVTTHRQAGVEVVVREERIQETEIDIPEEVYFRGRADRRLVRLVRQFQPDFAIHYLEMSASSTAPVAPQLLPPRGRFSTADFAEVVVVVGRDGRVLKVWSVDQSSEIYANFALREVIRARWVPGQVEGNPEVFLTIVRLGADSA